MTKFKDLIKLFLNFQLKQYEIFNLPKNEAKGNHLNTSPVMYIQLIKENLSQMEIAIKEGKPYDAQLRSVDIANLCVLAYDAAGQEI